MNLPSSVGKLNGAPSNELGFLAKEAQIFRMTWATSFSSSVSAIRLTVSEVPKSNGSSDPWNAPLLYLLILRFEARQMNVQTLAQCNIQGNDTWTVITLGLCLAHRFESDGELTPFHLRLCI